MASSSTRSSRRKPVDPVAQALRDSSTHRQPVKDNGYAASVAGLDFRTAGQKEA